MKKLTSVEWLLEYFKDYGIDIYQHQYEINQVKEMHKQEIIDSHKDGGIFFTEPSRQERAEDYYQNTYEYNY